MEDLQRDKMRAVVYQGNGRVSLEERPVPVIQDAGDAIVKVTQPYAPVISTLNTGPCPGQCRELFWGMSL